MPDLPNVGPNQKQFFGGGQDARAFCLRFFQRYNHEHRHGDIGLMIPWMVQTGRAGTVREARQNRPRSGAPTPPAAFCMQSATAANPNAVSLIH